MIAVRLSKTLNIKRTGNCLKDKELYNMLLIGAAIIKKARSRMIFFATALLRFENAEMKESPQEREVNMNAAGVCGLFQDGTPGII